MKAAKGSEVATEPGSVKGMSDGVALFVRKGEEFHVVGCRIDHGKCKNGVRLAIGAVRAWRMFGGFDGRLGHNPGADKIDVDFFPGINVILHLDREVAIFFALFLVVLAGCANLYMLFDVGCK